MSFSGRTPTRRRRLATASPQCQLDADVDGNKRIGHAAMELFLVLNGFSIRAGVDELESLILSVASGTIRRQAFTSWLHDHTDRLEQS